MPRYITIKRGFFICASKTIHFPPNLQQPLINPLLVLSYAICPWYLLSSASIFITFLSSYQIFLSAIAGILICDYYLIRRGHLNITALYTSHPESLYRYFYGFNLWAFATYIIAVAPNFYGFLSQMGVKAPLGIQRFYYVAYPTGLLVAFIVYYFGCLVFSPKGMVKGMGWKEPMDYVDEDDVSGDVIYGVEVDHSKVEKGGFTATKDVKF
jgi:NCS1 family nucleobase:cation symporter-1